MKTALETSNYYGVSKMELADLRKLADELIELRCDRASVGNFYEYLLRAYGGDANRAKADFMLYLSGDLPTRVLHAAAEAHCRDALRTTAGASMTDQEPTNRPRTSSDLPGGLLRGFGAVSVGLTIVAIRYFMP